MIAITRRKPRPRGSSAILVVAAIASLGEPNISREEIDADEVVVRIQAIPLQNADGPKPADEVLAAVAGATEAA